MRTKLLLCLIIVPLLSMAQVQGDEMEFRTIDNILLNGKVYTIKANYTIRDFKFKICSKDSCYGPTQDFDMGIAPETLSKAIINFAIVSQVDNDLTDESLVDQEERSYLELLLDKVKDLVESDKSEVQRLTESIDRNEEMVAATIVLRKRARINRGKNRRPEKQPYRNMDSSHSHDGEEMEIDVAIVDFFNNKASSIKVEGRMICSDHQEDVHLYNNLYGIPIRAFTFYDNVSKKVHVDYRLNGVAQNGEEIYVYVNDIFDYKISGKGNEGNYGLSIANQKFRLSNIEKGFNSYPVKQRHFFNFFNAVVFSDLMGFNTENSNSMINAQASLLMPMNLGNWGRISALRQFRLMANIALNNSFENENRFIGFADSEPVSHFDLYKKNNLNATISTDVLSIEAKGWFSTISLGYNLGFYRTGYQYTNTQEGEQDMVSKGQLLSISHGPYVNFEFRPQDNFGADLMLSLEEFNLNDQIELNGRDFRKDIIEDIGNNYFIAKHNLVNLYANFYWLTNPDRANGGVYTRIGVTYHTPTDAIFPQVFVGYATNLTSFVNRFKKDENGNTTE